VRPGHQPSLFPLWQADASVHCTPSLPSHQRRTGGCTCFTTALHLLHRAPPAAPKQQLAGCEANSLAHPSLAPQCVSVLKQRLDVVDTSEQALQQAVQVRCCRKHALQRLCWPPNSPIRGSVCMLQRCSKPQVRGSKHGPQNLLGFTTAVQCRPLHFLPFRRAPHPALPG